jgi:hypothetical protein
MWTLVLAIIGIVTYIAATEVRPAHVPTPTELARSAIRD